MIKAYIIWTCRHNCTRIEKYVTRNGSVSEVLSYAEKMKKNNPDILEYFLAKFSKRDLTEEEEFCLLADFKLHEDEYLAN